MSQTRTETLTQEAPMITAETTQRTLRVKFGTETPAPDARCTECGAAYRQHYGLSCAVINPALNAEMEAEWSKRNAQSPRTGDT